MATNSVRFEYPHPEGLSDATVTITIKNESNTSLVTEAAMTFAANGVYYYDYTIPSDGYYYALMTCGVRKLPQTKYGTTSIITDGSASYDLCTVNDIKRITRFTNEFTSAEIGEFIQDAENEIYSRYRKPLRKVYTYIQQDHYSYWLGESKIYAIQKVEVSNAGAEGTGSEVVSGSYVGSLTEGFITFAGVGTSWVDDYVGNRIDVQFVPQIYHLLAENLASLYVLETQPTFSRGQGTFANPRLPRVRERVKELRKDIASWKGKILASSKFANYDKRRGEWISQDFYNLF